MAPSLVRMECRILMAHEHVHSARYAAAVGLTAGEAVGRRMCEGRSGGPARTFA